MASWTSRHSAVYTHLSVRLSVCPSSVRGVYLAASCCSTVAQACQSITSHFIFLHPILYTRLCLRLQRGGGFQDSGSSALTFGTCGNHARPADFFRGRGGSMTLCPYPTGGFCPRLLDLDTSDQTRSSAVAERPRDASCY